MNVVVSTQSTFVAHAPKFGRVVGGALALLAVILVALSRCLSARDAAKARTRFAAKVAANNAAYLASLHTEALAVATRAAEAADFEMAVALAAEEKREEERLSLIHI